MSNCPFCEIKNKPHHPRIESENPHAFAILDGFPITEGHTLIIPKRHVGSFFEITPIEHKSLFQLIEQIKPALDKQYQPAGYNIGINDGPAAGQTVPHLHIHLIPRYDEANRDPRGGVRWIIPEKADYWSGR